MHSPDAIVYRICGPAGGNDIKSGRVDVAGV